MDRGGRDGEMIEIGSRGDRETVEGRGGMGGERGGEGVGVAQDGSFRQTCSWKAVLLHK